MATRTDDRSDRASFLGRLLTHHQDHPAADVLDLISLLTLFLMAAVAAISVLAVLAVEFEGLV